MARLTVILTVVTTVIALLGGFRYLWNEWQRWREQRRTGRWMLVLASVSLLASPAWAVYSLPSTRVTTWQGQAGLDPIGGIPTYTGVTCAGLDNTGATDMTASIQTCLNAASVDTAVLLPAGVYKISSAVGGGICADSHLDIPSRVVLRGPKATASGPFLPTDDASMATLVLTNGNCIRMTGGLSKTAVWSATGEGVANGTSITSGYTQGSTALTLASFDAAKYVNGAMISVYQSDDDASDIEFPSSNYLGEDCGGSCVGSNTNAKQSYHVITNVSGSVVTITPALHWISTTPLLPETRFQATSYTKAGLENLRLYASDATTLPLVWMGFCKYCWIKGVEAYGLLDHNAGLGHFQIAFSYGAEVRDSYVHHGGGNDSGSNYGIAVWNWGSAHKIENNIVRDTRHGIIFNGGGSWSAVLYNYSDDNWESVNGQPTNPATNFLSEDAVSNHGSHPHMDLWEGNDAQSFVGDYFHGSSSGMTYHRNYAHCTRSTIGWPLSSPFNWSCFEDMKFNRGFNFTGNVAGVSTNPGVGVYKCDANNCTTFPIMFKFGYSGNNSASYADSLAYSTAILHGNYDYVTQGVSEWQGGADHALANSLYYTEKPTYFGACAWPAFGPDLNPITNTIPAKDRYYGTGLCGAVPPSIAPAIFIAEYVLPFVGIAWHFRRAIVACAMFLITGVSTVTMVLPVITAKTYYHTRQATAKIIVTVLNHKKPLD